MTARSKTPELPEVYSPYIVPAESYDTRQASSSTLIQNIVISVCRGS